MRKEFKIDEEKYKAVVEGHCPLTDKFRGQAHDKCEFNTGKKCFNCTKIFPLLSWIEL